MTKFNINGIEVMAKQWWKHGDSPDVLQFEWPGNTCPICGNEYVGHGFVGGITDGKIICPGDWIAIHPHGRARGYHHYEFEDAIPVIDGKVH